MSQSENPYLPQSAGYQPGSGGGPRPATATVFGILNIVFGLLALCGNVFSIVFFGAIAAGMMDEAFTRQMGPQVSDPTQQIIILVQASMGLLIGVLLIIAGVGLIRFLAWGRSLSNVSSILMILTSVVGLAIMLITLFADGAANSDPQKVGAAVGGVCGGLLNLLFPICSLIFLNRPSFVRAIKGTGNV